MDHEQIFDLLQKHRAALRGLGVRALVAFGPFARGESAPTSPVDLLLEMHPPHTFERYLQIKHYLKNLLARPVELVVESYQHPHVREFAGEDVVVLIAEQP